MDTERIKELAEKYEVPVEQMMIAIATFESCSSFNDRDVEIDWVLEEVFQK